MTWREKLIARILLLVAVMIADEPEIVRELKQISTHISAASSVH